MSKNVNELVSEHELNSPLAIQGGEPLIGWTPARYNPIGEEEKLAVNRVLDSGVLSDFIGAKGDQFLGGEKVLEFEKAMSEYYGVDHAVSVNSLTSGLICALGAFGLSPGDEVIVSPWTMCASATAILVWNAIPVFADIDPHTFNVSVKDIERKITSRTKALVVPSIFGQPAQLDAIKTLADKYGLKILEDAAQAPGVKYQGRYVGTWGDIGGFSFNYHKHVHCGEGGVCVTNDPLLAKRMQMIRNHAEAVVDEHSDLNNMLGFNFRLGEMEAAIAIEQLKKMDGLVNLRFEQSQKLNRTLGTLPGLHVPQAVVGEHAFYMYGLRYTGTNVPKAEIIAALKAEGVPGVCDRYVNVHRYPMYQKKQVYGESHFPWSMHDVEYDYAASCPEAERVNVDEYIGLSICQYDFSMGQIDDIGLAFHKVWRGLDLL